MKRTEPRFLFSTCCPSYRAIKKNAKKTCFINSDLSANAEFSKHALFVDQGC